MSVPISVEANRMAEEEVTWNLVTSVNRVVRGRRILLFATLSGLALSLLLAVAIKPYYTASAVFLPPKNTDLVPGTSASSLLLGGASSDSSDMYLGLLASRSVADDVIDHVGLMEKFKTKSRDDARKSLSNSSVFSLNKNTLISVEVRAGTRQLAADISNAYLAALYRLNGQMVASAAAHRSTFFDEQLQQQKNELVRAELDLKTTQERTGIVIPAGEAQAGLLAAADLQAQIGQAQARLAGLLLGGTDQNPDVVQARSLLTQLRGQLARQQADSSASSSSAGITSKSRLPGLTLENLQKEREVKVREGIYNALIQQYEKARLSASDPGPQLQIVDNAMPPERKSGPPRRLIIMAGTFLGFLAGLLYLLLAQPTQRLLASFKTLPAERG